MLKGINKLTLGTSNADTSFFLLMREIDYDICREAMQWIIEMNFSEEPPEALNLIICSPGGLLCPAFALVDIMRGSSIPVRTIGLGEIQSAGLMIFMAGTKGHRILTKNTSIMSHQYSSGTVGKQHELIASTKDFELIGERLLSHYKKCTGLSEKDIRKLLLPPTDVYLTAEEALKYGICDAVKTLA